MVGMDLVVQCLLVVTFTRGISVGRCGWKPYCCALKSEMEVSRETKYGLFSRRSAAEREH